jgi:hypothetical protein
MKFVSAIRKLFASEGRTPRGFAKRKGCRTRLAVSLPGPLAKFIQFDVQPVAVEFGGEGNACAALCRNNQPLVLGKRRGSVQVLVVMR